MTKRTERIILDLAGGMVRNGTVRARRMVRRATPPSEGDTGKWRRMRRRLRIESSVVLGQVMSKDRTSDPMQGVHVRAVSELDSFNW